MSDRPPLEIRSDVRVHGYIGAACPNCGRHRLELYIDGPESPGHGVQEAPYPERAVGIRCEKCGIEWLLDPGPPADFHSDHSDADPLNPRPEPVDWFRPADAGALRDKDQRA